MAEKLFNTRIQLKYDTWANWSKTTTAGQGGNLVLKRGEIGICEIPGSTGAGQSTSEPVVLFKVGNGTDAFKDLAWASAKAADVHGWAKMSQDEFVGNFLSLESSDGPSISYKIHEVFPSYEDLNKAIQDVQDAIPTEFGVMSVATADRSILIGGTAENPTFAVNFADDNEKDNVRFTVDTAGVHANVDLSNYKTKQTAVADPDSNGSDTEFIASISQDVNGKITVTKKAIDAANLKVKAASTADKVGKSLTLQIGGTTKATFDGSTAATFNVTAADLGLSGAMHFLGTSSTEITDGGTQKPTIGGKQITSLNLGDVVLYNNQEYIYSVFVDEEGGEGRQWELLGDESSYALKSVSITANEGLTGGGTLASTRTIGIAASGVTTAKIADAAITAAKIATNSIGQDHIREDAVGSDQITTNAVNSVHLNTSAVTTSKIADANVTAAKIASNAVTEAKINASAVTAGKIAASAITEAKIASNAVTTAKINAGAVTEAKIAASAVTTDKIAAGAVTTAKIADKAVTTAKIDDKAVTTAKIADKAIGAEQTKAYIASIGTASDETWVFYCGSSTALV